jgi:hypothetical protein
MNPNFLPLITTTPLFLRKLLLSSLFILVFQCMWSQTIQGPLNLKPNTEGVYSLSTNQTATWEVRQDGILTETHYNTNSVSVKGKDLCLSFISFKVTISPGKVLRKSIIVQDNVRPVFDKGFETASLPHNDLDGHKPTATDNSGKPVTVSLKSYSAMRGMCMMTLVWEARDYCGNTATMTQIVTPTTQDTEAPKLDFEQWVTYACDSIPNPFPSPKVTDNSNLVQITLVKEVRSYGNTDFCQRYGSYLYWEAIDACGNVTTAIQTVSIRDRVPPKFNTDTIRTFAVCTPYDIPAYRPHVKDNCSDPVIVNLIKRKSEPFYCGYKVWDTWEAYDACDNKSTAVQEIIIKDNIGPKFMPLANICTPCNMIPANFPKPMVMDNCDPAPVVTLSKMLGLPLGCTGMPYDLTLIWKAVDKCGNETLASQIVNVRAMCGMMPPTKDLVRQTESQPQAAGLKKGDKNDGETNSLETNALENALNLPVLNLKNTVQLVAYPNPTNGKIHFNLQSPVVGEAILSLFDATGRQIGVLKQAYWEGGKDVLLQYDIPNTTAQGLIFYKLSLGSVTVGGKINYLK